ncbi:MAG: DUF4956 domain-containing protein [Oscillospiraceae bacterium]|nr:DUF4956 domain-containing protein [Oscillospiraceae bacterium]
MFSFSNNFFGSILDLPGVTTSITPLQFFICTITSIVLGIIIAYVYTFRNNAYTKSFIISLATMPVVVQVIITLVNGNLGTGIAVFGAFSLIRFRSALGNAKEISYILLTAALGLATGMGFVGYALAFTLIVCALNIVLTTTKFGEPKRVEHDLRITVPEDMDYTSAFDDILGKYTRYSELVRARMINLGTLYQLTYRIELKAGVNQKEMIDEIRCRNGNLEIACVKVLFMREDAL